MASDDVEIMTAFMPVRHMIYFLQMMSIFTSPHLKLPPLFGAFLEWFANSSLMGVSATCLWARPVPDLYLLATTALLLGTFDRNAQPPTTERIFFNHDAVSSHTSIIFGTSIIGNFSENKCGGTLVSIIPAF